MLKQKLNVHQLNSFSFKLCSTKLGVIAIKLVILLHYTKQSGHQNFYVAVCHHMSSMSTLWYAITNFSICLASNLFCTCSFKMQIFYSVIEIYHEMTEFSLGPPTLFLQVQSPFSAIHISHKPLLKYVTFTTMQLTCVAPTC